MTGPRQAGKTTLTKEFLREINADKPYVNLEDLDTRDFATQDPRGFLGQFQNGAVLDEVQRTPDLFSYLQGIVDNDKRMGQFILTGSQQFTLRAGSTQSLAVRVGHLELLPLSLTELKESGYKIDASSSEDYIWKGGYPPIYDREVLATDWLTDYIVS